MKNRICEISLFTLILASVSAMPVDAAVRVKNANRSYAEAYQQVNEMRYQQEYNAAIATTASATANLPVAVDDERLANEILNNTASDTSVSSLEACAMIYPTGEFKWSVPESGIRRNQTNQCVAIVSLFNANTNEVLATTTVAAGDSMKCNIDSFPEAGMNKILVEKTELPADVAPTIEDVEAVMNEEQKQNAGLKIAAGAIISGLAGNLLAPKDAGAKESKTGLGFGKNQLIDTAIGAAAGAGIMAASTYSGKVAGDTIKSTAVNAASGMIVGNMMSGMTGGDSIMATTKCVVTEGTNASERDCVVGTVSRLKNNDNYSYNANAKSFLIISKTNNVLRECTNPPQDGNIYTCTTTSGYTNITIKNEIDKDVSLASLLKESDAAIANHDITMYHQPTDIENINSFKELTDSGTALDNVFFRVSTASKTTGAPIRAYAVFPQGFKMPFKFDGLTKDAWQDLSQNAKYYYRNSNGSVGSEIKPQDATETLSFEPSARDASDGGLVDLSNQSRAKGTAVGAAAGGALGGFSGYQGAQNEITERWTAAIREYNDSMNNFGCKTGTRFLSKYNDYVEIPQLTVSDD